MWTPPDEQTTDKLIDDMEATKVVMDTYDEEEDFYADTRSLISGRQERKPALMEYHDPDLDVPVYTSDEEDCHPNGCICSQCRGKPL